LNYDDTALRGLEFLHRECSSDSRVASLLRSKLLVAKDRDSICFEEGDLVAAEVICCSGACVHGILAGRPPVHLVLHVDSL